MKYRMIAYLGILTVGVTAYLYMAPNKPKWSPWYCSQYSGRVSYAWGGGDSSCISAGCEVLKTKEHRFKNLFDADGYDFKCVRKGGNMPRQVEAPKPKVISPEELEKGRQISENITKWYGDPPAIKEDDKGLVNERNLIRKYVTSTNFVDAPLAEKKEVCSKLMGWHEPSFFMSDPVSAEYRVLNKIKDECKRI